MYKGKINKSLFIYSQQLRWTLAASNLTIQFGQLLFRDFSFFRWFCGLLGTQSQLHIMIVHDGQHIENGNCSTYSQIICIYIIYKMYTHLQLTT